VEASKSLDRNQGSVRQRGAEAKAQESVVARDGRLRCQKSRSLVAQFAR
jgi:hypothetical protein